VVVSFGVTPIPASSGKTIRYRLNRGGDRNANAALYRIVVTRMSSHEETRRYVARRRAEGLNTAEIMGRRTKHRRDHAMPKTLRRPLTGVQTPPSGSLRSEWGLTQ
jgi:hypothetical protein